MKIIFSIIIFLTSILCYTQSIINANQFESYPIKEKVSRAIEAYSYFSGIEISLRSISEEHPDFSQRINRLNLLYYSNFGEVKNNALSYLKSLDEWPSVEKTLEKGINKAEFIAISSIPNASKEELEMYLSDLELQLKGNFDTPLLENFLSFQFLNQPHKEISSGYTYTFNAKGHRKSKNTDWQIKIPKSWYAKEGDRPNIIQKFISECGNGSEMIVLLVQDLNDAFDLNEIELELGEEKDDFLRELFYSEDFAKEMIPGNGSLISIQRISIAFNEAVMFTFETRMESFGIEIKMRMLYFMILNQDRIFYVQASVNTKNLKEDLSARMDKFLPLFMRVANSIVINNKKEDVIQLTGTSNRKFVSVMIGDNPYHFLLDTGASTSLLNKKTINELISNGIITSKNYIGQSSGKIADGSIIEFELWSIPELKISNRIINNITIAVIDGNNIEPLLGMDILEKLDVMKIDLTNDKIYLYNQY